jgi:putative tryptophan/tyrosine transport system substrate-binding protein
MTKKIMVFALCSLLLARRFPAEAQQPGKVYRVGYLQISTREQQLHFVKAFEEGMRDLGYVVGKNLIIEYRFANGKMEQLSQLAADLVRLKVDAIVTGVNPNTVAAKEATSTIPIIMAFGNLPVEARLIASLSQPGGNVTGLTIDAGDEVPGKRLELLKEAVPRLSRIAVLRNPANAVHGYYLKTMEGSAQSMKLTLLPFEYRSSSDFESIFRAIINAHANGITVLGDGIVFNQRDKVAKLAMQNRLPSIYPNKDYVEAGGLMSYGPDFADNMRRAATYVDKILKGAKPADLPVEQPTKFEFIINLKAAKQIGLTIPQSVLYQADKVIR